MVFIKRALIRHKRGLVQTINDVHPETRQGEIFLCNANALVWSDIDLMTKRWGSIAYHSYSDTKEVADKSFKPVFVATEELSRRGVCYNIRTKF